MSGNIYVQRVNIIINPQRINIIQIKRYFECRVHKQYYVYTVYCIPNNEHFINILYVHICVQKKVPLIDITSNKDIYIF